MGVYTDKGKISWDYFQGAWGRGGAYIPEDKHFNLQSVKLVTFFLFIRFSNNHPQMVRITFI